MLGSVSLTSVALIFKFSALPHISSISLRLVTSAIFHSLDLEQCICLKPEKTFAMISQKHAPLIPDPVSAL